MTLSINRFHGGSKVKPSTRINDAWHKRPNYAMTSAELEAYKRCAEGKLGREKVRCFPKRQPDVVVSIASVWSE